MDTTSGAGPATTRSELAEELDKLLTEYAAFALAPVPLLLIEDVIPALRAPDGEREAVGEVDIRDSAFEGHMRGHPIVSFIASPQAPRGQYKVYAASPGYAQGVADAAKVCSYKLRALPPAEPPLQAHSKSEYRRMSVQGANVLPPTPSGAGELADEMERLLKGAGTLGALREYHRWCEIHSDAILASLRQGYAQGVADGREEAAKVCEKQAELRYHGKGIGHVTDAAVGMAQQLADEIRALAPPRAESGGEARWNGRKATLLEELRIEAALVPNRRGKLYGLAADEIERLQAAPAGVLVHGVSQFHQPCPAHFGQPFTTTIPGFSVPGQGVCLICKQESDAAAKLKGAA